MLAATSPQATSPLARATYHVSCGVTAIIPHPPLSS